MIYDFGCLTDPVVLSRILPAMPGALAAFAVIAGLATLGAALNRSQSFQAQDIFSGWGLVAAIMTLAAVNFEKPLPFVTLFLFIAMAVAAIPALRRRYFVSPFWLLALFPGLFILTAINMAGIAKWDDFSHWVPNALYLFHNNDVPAHSLSPSHSVWPGYPYAIPFLTYMASRLANGFLMQGGAMINFLLLMAFAPMLADIYASAKEKSRPFIKTALALFFVTLGNPSFNASFTVTNQGDTSTMVLVGALALMLWRLVPALADKKASTQKLIIPVALASVALVLIKQVNIVLLGLLVFAFLVVAWKNARLKPALKTIPSLILPALIMRFVWQHYVDMEMGGNGFGIRPLQEWRFDLLPQILQAVGMAMLKKNGQFGLLWLASIFGLIGFFRKPDPLRNFLLLAGIVFLGYLTFLFMTYLGSNFTEAEVLRGGYVYRYCTHVGLLGLTSAWMAAPHIWKWLRGKIGTLPAFKAPNSSPLRIIYALALMLLLPVGFWIQKSWLVPQPSPQACAERAIGHRIASALPDKSQLAVLEPEGDGLFIHMVNLELEMEEARSGKASVLTHHLSRFESDRQAERLTRIQQDPELTALYVTQAKTSPIRIWGYDNAKSPLFFERKGKAWKRITLAAPDKSG